MFFSEQSSSQKSEYIKLLQLVGSLSNLFSNSKNPYLYYRVAERVFCNAFDAEDLSRSDISLDAKKDKKGIGLKTFLENNNRTLQKIAEFNSESNLFRFLKGDDIVQLVSDLRNNRVEFTEKTHSIDSSFYHCVLRSENQFKIFEEPLTKINLAKVTNITDKKNTISFEDDISEYVFSKSKNTLFKRFVVDKTECEFDVDIIKNPIDALKDLLNQGSVSDLQKPKEFIYLPLYGMKDGMPTVFPKSGLNQWNAQGRVRDPDEVYIPIPAIIHKTFPGFFPARDVMFNLQFPDGEKVQTSVCQDGGKALMTKKNKKLGKLILRDGLKLEEGELVTYEKLTLLGCDSVRIEKLGEDLYKIDFAKVDSYEVFKLSWE